jgi:dGTPase
MVKFYNDADFLRLSGLPGTSNNETGRTAFRKDYARLLHAPSFRRLQGKTQLFPGTESDFFRNRLTHSLEVAQVAAGIAETLNAAHEELKSDPIDRDLVQFAALAHDLGHPPFGHNGEKALDELMRQHGGFEGNAQTLRILTNSEKKLISLGNGNLESTFGLDLTFRTLASVLKYDNEIPKVRRPNEKLAKGYYASESKIVKEIKDRVAPGFTGKKFKSIECAIMDLADDIAYSTYDLEDSFHAGFVTPISLFQALYSQNEIRAEVYKKTNEALVEAGYEPLKTPSELLDAMVKVLDYSTIDKISLPDPADSLSPEVEKVVKNAMVLDWNEQLASNSLIRTRFTAHRIGNLIRSVEFGYNNRHPALSSVRLQREALLDVEILKHLNYEVVIRSPRLAVAEYRGKDIVKEIFNALLKSKGELLPDEWKHEYKSADTNEDLEHRVICEFIAGMTDRYAVEFHDALFGEGKSLYKPL